MQMFSSKDRALYHSGKLLTLGKISKSKMHGYISRRFEETGQCLKGETIDQLLSISDNIPYYNQYLAAQLWEKFQERTNDEDEKNLLERAVDNILINQDEYYFTIYDRMTLYQRSVIKAIIKENGNLFSKSYHDRHNLTSPSSTKRAVDSLIEQGVLDKREGEYLFSDPFFPCWLRFRSYA